MCIRDSAFASWLSLVTGMRVGEVCAVQRIDVKRALSYVHVGGNVIEGKGKKPYRRNVTKGRKCRNIALTQDDIAVIDAFTKLQSAVLGRLGADCPLVTLDGSYMRPTTISRAFSRIRDACGLPREITFHSLRHTHASWPVSYTHLDVYKRQGELSCGIFGTCNSDRQNHS